MRNKTLITRNVVSLLLVAGGMCAAHEARGAEACDLGASEVAGANPAVAACEFLNFVASGNTTAGVDILAQDHSSTSVSGMFAFEADSLNNSAIKATAGSGSGFGVDAIAASGEGVFGETSGTSVAGVHGKSTTANGWGVHGESTGAGTGVFGDNTNTSGWSGYFNGNLYVQDCISQNGNVVAGSCSSDARLKKNVQTLTGALDKLVQLRPVTFEWKDPEQNAGNTAGVKKGLIAQEVEKVLPEWVGTDERGFRTVNRDDLPVMLLASVKTLKAENDDLRERVKSLEAGRRPTISRMGEGGIGLGMLGLAAAIVFARRKQEARS